MEKWKRKERKDSQREERVKEGGREGERVTETSRAKDNKEIE